MGFLEEYWGRFRSKFHLKGRIYLTRLPAQKKHPVLGRVLSLPVGYEKNLVEFWATKLIHAFAVRYIKLETIFLIFWQYPFKHFLLGYFWLPLIQAAPNHRQKPNKSPRALDKKRGLVRTIAPWRNDTLDGSEIRRSPPGMYRNLVNSRINYLLSGGGFLPRDQYLG